MQINIEQAKQYLTIALKAKRAVMLSSSPGIGKSDLVKQIANQYKLKLISVFLNHYDPTDIHGFPVIKDKYASYVPFDSFPTEHTTLSSKYNGFLLFFDEFNSAPLATQAAAYRVILDKYVGQYALHPKTAIICAGNLSSDNAIVNRLSTAMQSRLIHLNLIADITVWLKWANNHNIDHRITAFLGYRPELLHKFDPDHNDVTFPCPRTWYFLSCLLDNISNISETLSLIAGTIGEAAAHEFMAYTEVYSRIPSIQQILANPYNIQFDQDPAIMYALSNMVANYIKPTNLVTLIQFIQRLPLEFQTILIQNAVQRVPNLMNETVLLDWITKTAITIA